MFDWFKKQYVILVQLDSCKEAELVGDKEGFGNLNVNQYNEDLFRNNKVSVIIPKKRWYFGALRQSLQYSKMGIFNCVMKKPNIDEEDKPIITIK